MAVIGGPGEECGPDLWINMAAQATGGHKGVLVQAYSKDGVFLETLWTEN